MSVLVHDIEIAADAVVFCKDVLKIKPDRWQREALNSKSHYIIMNCSRQSGKTLIGAVKALHTALFIPDSLTLIIAPTQRQSKLTFHTVKQLVLKVRPLPDLPEDNTLSATFTNGSRIISLPADEARVRGHSAVDLIIEDEAARAPDTLYKAVRPMLAASGGTLLLASTPFGKRGHFYEEWTGSPRDEWHRISVTADQVSRIKKSYLKVEFEKLGKLWYEQEFFCRFIELQGQAIASTLVERALDDSIEPFLDSEEYFTGRDEEWADILLG